MLRKFGTIFATIGVLVGGILFIMLLGSLRPEIERQEPELAPPTVFYQIAKPQAVTLDAATQGEVRPRTDINLTAQVAGRVVDVSPAFVDGGAFEKGDLLVRIEPQDYSLAVTGARARVAQAKEILTREEAEAELAQQDFQELGGNSEASDLTLRKPQLAQARASFDAAFADLLAAKLNLERTEIKAPFKGRVRQRLAGPGQFLTPGAQLGRIYATDIVEIRLPLTDADLAKLGLPIAFIESPDNPGPPVKLAATLAGEFHEWTGRIARTDGAIDPATRQISAIAVVDDPYGDGADDGTPLAVGLYVEARIEGRPFNNAFVLPRAALHGRDIVYVVNDENVLEERKIIVASSEAKTFTAVNGIVAGDRIVTSPLRGSKAGDTVVPEDPAVIPIGPPAREETDNDEETGAAVAKSIQAGDNL